MRDNVSSLSRGSWLSHGPCYSIQSNPIRKFVIGYGPGNIKNKKA